MAIKYGDKDWKPKPGEWIWARHMDFNKWGLYRFKRREGQCWVVYELDPDRILFMFQIAQFKGELPPGLELW